MDISIEAIIFYILLVDSIGANVVTWLGIGTGWYARNFQLLSRYFPAARGWTTYYLILVLWVGFALYRLDVLPY